MHKHPYAALGIPEYWVVDVQEQRVFAFLLQADGQYRLCRNRCRDKLLAVFPKPGGKLLSGTAGQFGTGRPAIDRRSVEGNIRQGKAIEKGELIDAVSLGKCLHLLANRGVGTAL